MKNAEAINQTSGNYDLIRHLLRVTVMLNTIATLRKKKYLIDDDEEVILKLEQMRTIGYDHKSKISSGKKLSQTELKTLYPSTTVKVINEDCLVLYEQLVSKGHRPLLLNMANATNPGGGYRKGDGAQEENIFRRSDYYHSLDGEIADKDRSERIYCTPKYELKPLKGYGGFYPMEEFGAIYTSGITVFRGTEAEGYPYMKNPLYDVCAIAMAAYRDPLLTKTNTLENKPAIKTRKKIENIFAIAHQHKHNCLVLSAFGCGAFRNPPKHVALLFKSVIYQYAGYFDRIYFAIIDDHNTGNQINPHGNFLPFKQLLDGLVVEPPKTLRIDGVSGPYRILDKTSGGQLTLGDVCILNLPPCQHGTICRDLKNVDHTRQYSHPPRCSLQSAISTCDQMDDAVHMFTFIHTMKCKHGGECTSKDPAHLNDYDHPEYCKDGSDCRNISLEHLFDYRHLPICRDGIDCSKYLRHDFDHMKLYRHCKSVCPQDNCCNYFHEKVHMKNTIHSFREPCPFTPYNCSKYVEYVQNDNTKRSAREVEQHCLQYSHVCLYGRQCKKTNLEHYETSIHIARQLCPDGGKCSKLAQEDHLESFSHPDIRDIRLFCREPGYKCSRKATGEHLRKYRHGQNHNHLNVAPSSNLNSHVNFVQNQRELIKNVNNYVETSNWKKAKMPQEIPNWIRALQPVHRCSPLIFESILVHGHVMSRHYMKLLERPKYVANAVLQHSRVRLIFLKHNNPAVKDNAFKLIRALVEAEFSKTGADGITKLDPDHDEKVNMVKMRLKASLADHDLKIINDWTVKIAQASIKLHSSPMGIGFGVDEKMGTDKHVFSILGPHLGYYYGDIVITFKQEIMFHPDANFSIQAATSFNSGRTYDNRPWVTNPGTDKKCVEDFHRSKLHCSVPRYELAAATELVALTGKSKKSMNVDLDAVIARWMKVDSHDTFESHLPQLIPLDYVDCVYMPKNVFESLTPEAQQSAKGAFKDSLILTPHVIDLSLIKPGATVTLDSTRVPYQKLILNKIDEKIQQRIKTPRISRGIVITVPGSHFEEHIVLPMTISQSYDLYCLDHAQAPTNPEYTYIYWQAMHGDMMLTIANHKIEPSKDQSNLRCLVCYVAEKPSTNAEDYHESYSYLNDGHPYQHDVNIHEMTFKAKSNVFYRGCNNDDFFTFRLKLSHKTGEVTLSHAGPNGIYNHQKISYQFNKADLDLSRIDYVHVSGGNQDVPLRNLTINHEPVSVLHPSFDKDFKIDTSQLLRKRRASVDHTFRASFHRDTPNSNKNAASKPNKQRSASVERAPPSEEPSVFGRMLKRIFGSSSTNKSREPNPSSSNQPKSHPTKAESPQRNRSRTKSPPHNRSRSKSSSRDRSRTKSPPCNRSRSKSSSSDRSRTKLPPRNRSSTKSPPHDQARKKSPLQDRARPKPSSRDRSRTISPPYDRARPKTSSRNRSRTKSPSDDRSRKKPSLRNRSISKSPTSSRSRNKSPPLISSKLPLCRDSVYCLNQSSRDHTEKYSHPCRFNELCRRQTDEPHLIHEHHNVSRCSDDKDCRERTNPVHRAKYRHTGLPDYLLPCRYQDNCYDKSSEHRLKYFHGEELPSIKSNYAFGYSLKNSIFIFFRK
jgi:uncharacterized protein (TIGR02452 family)